MPPHVPNILKMVRDVSSCVDDAISVTEIENSESWTEKLETVT